MGDDTQRKPVACNIDFELPPLHLEMRNCPFLFLFLCREFVLCGRFHVDITQYVCLSNVTSPAESPPQKKITNNSLTPSAERAQLSTGVHAETAQLKSPGTMMYICYVSVSFGVLLLLSSERFALYVRSNHSARFDPNRGENAHG